MKEKLTLRNLLLCFVALFGLLVFIFSFVTNVKAFDKAGDWNGTYNSVIWGCKSMTVPYLGEVALPKPYGALGLPLVGSILVFVGALAAFCISLLVKKEKAVRIVLVLVAVAMIAGGVFVMLTPLSLFNALAERNAAESGLPLDKVKEAMKAAGGSLSSSLAIVSGILAILGGIAACVSVFFGEKKLVK